MEKKHTKMVERVYCGVRFALMLDPRHAPAGGKYPVCVRITHNYKQRYILHGDKCTVTEFSRAAKSGKGDLYERRREWERFFDHIYNSVKAEVDDGTFSVVAFRQPGEPVDGVTINRVFREYISNLEADGKSTTAHIYRYVLLKLEQYFGLVDADAVDKVFVNGFRRKMEEEGLSGTTQGIYLRHLRSVFNYGIYKEYMKRSQYPFSQGRYRSDSVRIPAGVSRTERYLDKEDMRKLYECYPEDREVNMFLFSYLANGANLVDILKLKFDDYWAKSGRTELRFVRQKTKDTTGGRVYIYVPITQWLREVMKRLGIEEKKGALLFPDAMYGCDTPDKEAKRVGQVGKNIGVRMKAVCTELGIDGSVSMTWARHSYKTVLIRQKVPDWFCEQMMGHTSGSVGAHYVGMFTAEDRMKYNTMLL